MVSLQKQLSDDHRRASKVLAYALHIGSSDIWIDAPNFWRTRLTRGERAALAYSVLMSLEPDHAHMVCEAVLGQQTMPGVPLFSAIDEAAHWADFADDDSIKAFVQAGFNQLSPDDQMEFLNHAMRRSAS